MSAGFSPILARTLSGGCQSWTLSFYGQLSGVSILAGVHAHVDHGDVSFAFQHQVRKGHQPATFVMMTGQKDAQRLGRYVRIFQ